MVTPRCPYCAAIIVSESLQQDHATKVRCTSCGKIVTLAMEVVAKKNCVDNNLEHVFEIRGSVGKCINCDAYAWQAKQSGEQVKGKEAVHE